MKQPATAKLCCLPGSYNHESWADNAVLPWLPPCLAHLLMMHQLLQLQHKYASALGKRINRATM